MHDKYITLDYLYDEKNEGNYKNNEQKKNNFFVACTFLFIDEPTTPIKWPASQLFGFQMTDYYISVRIYVVYTISHITPHTHIKRIFTNSPMENRSRQICSSQKFHMWIVCFKLFARSFIVLCKFHFQFINESLIIFNRNREKKEQIVGCVSIIIIFISLFYLAFGTFLYDCLRFDYEPPFVNVVVAVCTLMCA